MGQAYAAVAIVNPGLSRRYSEVAIWFAIVAEGGLRLAFAPHRRVRRRRSIPDACRARCLTRSGPKKPSSPSLSIGGAVNEILGIMSGFTVSRPPPKFTATARTLSYQQFNQLGLRLIFPRARIVFGKCLFVSTTAQTQRDKESHQSIQPRS